MPRFDDANLRQAHDGGRVKAGALLALLMAGAQAGSDVADLARNSAFALTPAEREAVNCSA